MSNDYSDIKIDWQSEVTAKMGYGLQTRRMLKPLIDGGADIKFIPDEDYLPPYMKIEDPFWLDQIEKSKSKPDSKVRVCYCLPHRYKPNPQAKTVGYTMWETDQYPRQWADIINRTCNYFFAGCNSLVSSAIKAKINVPIIPVNATLDVDSWTPEGPITNISEIPPGTIKFLFIGNFIPRKNLEQLLTGFACAFEGYTDVALIIKTWSSSNDANGKKHISDSIRHLYNKTTGLSSKPKVSVITDILDEDQMISLIRGCDVYTSVSKGEGFDLPMMQAMALEKLIVTTRFLAHSDYLTDQNSINVEYTFAPCVDAMAPLYDSYQHWSSPDMESYILSLRQAYMHIKNGTADSIKKNARLTIVEKYSNKVNTEVLANTLRKIMSGAYDTKKNIKESIKKVVL